MEATADHSARLCVRDLQQLSSIAGRAYLPDATEDFDALMLEPLWRRPCQASVQDNPFATSYEHGGSFWNCACSLALFCSVVGGTQSMFELVEEWHTESLLSGCNCVYAADAMILISTMYPVEWLVDKECLPEAYAKALPAVVKAYESGKNAVLSEVVEESLVQQARSYWSAFSRTTGSAWKEALEPLLQCIIKWDGSHDMNHARKEEMRARFDCAARGAWLVHSPDGVSKPRAECPASEVESSDRVRRPQMDPIFTADILAGIMPRGALVGLKSHQLRQVVALALAAHVEDVEVQVVRNEGARRSVVCVAFARLRACVWRRRFVLAHQFGGGHAGSKGPEALSQVDSPGADGGRGRRVWHARGQGGDRRAATQRLGQEYRVSYSSFYGDQCSTREQHSRARRGGSHSGKAVTGE